jgi:hypothetical protein
MLLVFDTTLLTVKTVNSMYISHSDKESVGPSPVRWYNPSTWHLKPAVTKQRMHKLTVNYVMYDQRECVYTSEAADLNVLERSAKEILKQVRMQTDIANQEMVDQLFEDALKETP